jgi:hypothetical protein
MQKRRERSCWNVIVDAGAMLVCSSFALANYSYALSYVAASIISRDSLFLEILQFDQGFRSSMPIDNGR